MHSFQPSRGRILFEVFCAFGLVASCVGAWKQTGASALLAAASFAGLYGFVRLFDLARSSPIETVEPQRIEFEPEVQCELPAYQNVVVPMVAVEPEPAFDQAVEDAEAVEPVAPQAKRPRRAKAPRKADGLRASAAKRAKVVEIDEQQATDVVVPMASAENEVVVPMAPAEAEVPEPMAPEEGEMAEQTASEETAHIPLAPLFEPAPYVHVRQQRAAFGRKAR